MALALGQALDQAVAQTLGQAVVTERNGRINVFFPCDGCSELCDRVCVHSLIAEARMPGSFARAAPVVGSSEPLPDPGQEGGQT